MFTLQDGREHLYQWDLDRYIIVNDATICEVHFCNRTSDCSLVVEVKDGLAAIPNILLQDARPIRAYAYCDDKYTLTESQFTVKSRTKPSDYVYEETTVVRVDVLLDRAEQAITTAEELKEYFDTHVLEVKDDGEGNVTLDATIPEGGEVNLDNYYTKAETNAAIEEAIEGIEIPEPDLTNYATQQFVLDKVAEIDIPDVSNFITEIPAEYITETELDSKGYLTEHQDISGKADKEHTHPQYLTEHQSLEAYAKKSDIPDVSDFITAIPDEYITETELNNKGYLTEHQSLAGYATEKYVDDAVANIDIPDGGATEVVYLNFSRTSSSWTRATTEEAEIFERLASGEQLAIYIKEGYAHAPVDVHVMNADNIYFILHSTPWSSGGSPQTQVIEFHANKYNDAWDIKENRKYLKTYVTAEEVNTIVNEALSGIATAEGGSY